jgi:hypothetical protein
MARTLDLMLLRCLQITPNVKFDTIAREWRFKWSPDADKQSLVEAQNALESVLKEVKGVKGVKSVQRVVCGGNLSASFDVVKYYIFIHIMEYFLQFIPFLTRGKVEVMLRVALIVELDADLLQSRGWSAEYYPTRHR